MRRYADISLVDATMDLIWLRLLDLLVMAGIAILFLLGLERLTSHALCGTVHAHWLLFTGDGGW